MTSRTEDITVYSVGSHLVGPLGSHLGFPHLDMSEVTSKYLDELLILENPNLPLLSLGYLPYNRSCSHLLNLAAILEAILDLPI